MPFLQFTSLTKRLFVSGNLGCKPSVKNDKFDALLNPYPNYYMHSNNLNMLDFEPVQDFHQ